MVIEKTKTYTRKIYRIMSWDEVKSLFRTAHERCREKVKPTIHYVGGTYGGTKRKVISRPKESYMACVRSELEALVREKLGA